MSSNLIRSRHVSGVSGVPFHRMHIPSKGIEFDHETQGLHPNNVGHVAEQAAETASKAVWTTQMIGMTVWNVVLTLSVIGMSIWVGLIAGRVIAAPTSTTEVTNTYVLANGTNFNGTIPIPTTSGIGIPIIDDALNYIFRSIGPGYGTAPKTSGGTVSVDLVILPGENVQVTNVSGNPRLSVPFRNATNVGGGEGVVADGTALTYKSFLPGYGTSPRSTSLALILDILLQAGSNIQIMNVSGVPTISATIPVAHSYGGGADILINGTTFDLKTFIGGSGISVTTIGQNIIHSLALLFGDGLVTDTLTGTLRVNATSQATGITNVTASGLALATGTGSTRDIYVPMMSDATDSTGVSLIADALAAKLYTPLGVGGLSIYLSGGNMMFDVSAISGGGALTYAIGTGLVDITWLNATVPIINVRYPTSIGSGLSLIANATLFELYTLIGTGGITCSYISGNTIACDGSALAGNNATLLVQIFPAAATGFALVNGTNTVKNLINDTGLTITDEGDKLRLGLNLIGGPGIYVNNSGNAKSITNTGVVAVYSADVAYGATGVGLMATQGTGTVVTRNLVSTPFIQPNVLNSQQVELIGSGVQQGPTGISPVATQNVQTMGIAVANYQSDITPTVTIGTFHYFHVTFDVSVQSSSIQTVINFGALYPISGPYGYLKGFGNCIRSDNQEIAFAIWAHTTNANTIQVVLPTTTLVNLTFTCGFTLHTFPY